MQTLDYHVFYTWVEGNDRLSISRILNPSLTSQALPSLTPPPSAKPEPAGPKLLQSCRASGALLWGCTLYSEASYTLVISTVTLPAFHSPKKNLLNSHLWCLFSSILCLHWFKNYFTIILVMSQTRKSKHKFHLQPEAQKFAPFVSCFYPSSELTQHHTWITKTKLVFLCLWYLSCFNPIWFPDSSS